jgi:asparagine synthase (glutamine-hydrolysing)
MCGSVALMAKLAELELPLRQALSLLEARGPDGSGFAFCANGALGHCRLSLRDAAGGVQPRELSDGRLLAYVGELYNDAKLRSLLELEGWKSATHGDTEVMARAIERWGDRIWELLDGMFAVTIMSAQGDSLELVRDRFGIKPLYFARNTDIVAAASEPAALLNTYRTATASFPALVHFLQTSHVTWGNRTVWDGISLVPPGSKVQLTHESANVTRWSKHTTSGVMAADPALAANKLRYLLGEAVYRQRQADFPVGIFLSGGVDSSLLAALLALHDTAPVKSFAVALEGDADDLDQANLMAKHINADHRELVVSPDEFFAAMRELTAQRALPVSLPNEVLIFQLSKFAKQHVKAVLCGEGADELFGGYHRLQARLDAIGGDIVAQLHAYRNSTAWFTHEDLANTLVETDVLNEWKSEDRSYLQAVLPQGETRNFAQDLLLNEHYPHLLLRLDGATMAAGLEGRVPFADSDVVRFAESLPSEMLLPAFGMEKPLVRKAGQGLLPEAILRRPKRAFNASLNLLFSSPAGQAALERALHLPLIRKLFRQETLEQLLTSERETLSLHRTWLICSLGLWFDACRVSEIS